MSAYTTLKISRSRVAVFKDGEELLQLMPKEVAGWIAAAERRDAEEIEFKAYRRKYRVANAEAYLAARASRVKASDQLSFDF